MFTNMVTSLCVLPGIANEKTRSSERVRVQRLRALRRSYRPLTDTLWLEGCSLKMEGVPGLDGLVPFTVAAQRRFFTGLPAHSTRIIWLAQP